MPLLGLSFTITLALWTNTFPLRSVQSSESAKTKGSEETAAVLDEIRNYAVGIGSPAVEGAVIIIAHLGPGERSQVLNKRRLHNVRGYLVGHGIPTDRVITVEGLPVKGIATIEVFLGGKLRLSISVDQGRDVRVDCCGEFPQYYPWYRGRPVLK